MEPKEFLDLKNNQPGLTWTLPEPDLNLTWTEFESYFTIVRKVLTYSFKCLFSLELSSGKMVIVVNPFVSLNDVHQMAICRICLECTLHHHYHILYLVDSKPVGLRTITIKFPSIVFAYKLQNTVHTIHIAIL